MNVLVVGGTGATGSQLVRQLLERGVSVRAIVRSADRVPANIRNHENLTLIEGEVIRMTDRELEEHVKGCEAVASCLGHRVTFGGLFGPPYRLVRDSLRRLCRASEKANGGASTKIVLMCSSGVRNRKAGEKVSFGETIVIALLRLLVPPHADNEAAAAYLQDSVGFDNSALAWVAVRPDGLIDEDAVSKYELVPSPTRSAIFDAGKVSRINVAHCMAELMTNEALWAEWKGQMPVLYGSE